MKKKSLHKDIDKATTKLLEMARNSCWNKISNNCEFILSEIDDTRASNFFEERKFRKSENINKKAITLKQATDELKEIYTNLNDVNLHIFRSMNNKTIIDIRYFLKTKLDLDYQQQVKDKEPMLHCKIGIPPYHTNKEDKYDVNWELGGIRAKWKMFAWRSKYKLSKMIN